MNAKLIPTLLALVVAASSAKAADGTWTQIISGTASGTWNDAVTSSWAGGTVAGGTGATANFNTLDISGTSTVTLTAPRTIGNIIFGDTGTGATASNWVLTGTGANSLTLSGTAPTITVNTLGSTSLTSATISASISGTNGLIKDGNGTVASSANSAIGLLVLSGSNNYTGGTTISSGALRAQNSSALGTGAVTVANGAQLQVHGSVTIANTININGANALFSSTGLSGTPNLSGLINLQSNSGLNLASNSGNATLLLSGTVNLGGNILTANTINLDPAITISGVVVGTSGGINKAGAGTLLMSGNNAATYSGTTTLTAGVLALGDDNALGTGVFAFNPANNAAANIRSSGTTARTIATAVTIGNGVSSRYLFGSTSVSANGNLTFTNTTTMVLSSGTKFFEVANRTQFDAGFGGTGIITMQTTGSTGLGTLVLNGSNSYTGATNVNAGTLLIGGSLSSSSVVTVTGTGSATATLGGNGTIGGATTLGANSFLTPGEVGIVGNLKFSSSLNIAGITQDTGAMKFDLGSSSDTVTLSSGVLTIGSGLLDWADFNFNTLSGFGAGTYTLFATNQTINGTLGLNLSGTIGGFNANIALGDGGTDLVLTVVPEPAVSILGGAGLMTLLLLRRRTKIEG